jgi:hypothetical protein
MMPPRRCAPGSPIEDEETPPSSPQSGAGVVAFASMPTAPLPHERPAVSIAAASGQTAPR